jgi:hypothetical protein
VTKPTKVGLLLDTLRSAGAAGVTSTDLVHAGVGYRYGAVVARAREQGHVIQTDRVSNERWRYTLVREADSGEPAHPARSPEPIEPPPPPLAGQDALFDVPPHELRWSPGGPA